MSRSLILLATAATAATAGAFLASSVGVPASRAQPLTCLTVQAGNVVQPRMFTGNGTGSSQSSAMNAAQSNWGSQVSSFSFAGPAYAFWNKAARKQSSCSSQKVGFSYRYTCRVTAQPCK